MKKLKFMAIALVAMFGFTACDNECEHELNKACEHEYIEVDYSKALVGTWTCMDEDYAEAMVIKADGSVEVTGVVDGEYFESKGTIKVVNNKMIYALDNGDEWEGRFEMTAGESFSMIWDDELDIRYTYHYCENNLADEVVGMWVCHESLPGVENDMAIITYSEDGKMAMTAQASAFIAGDFVNVMSDYKVVGDLVFKILPKENVPEGAVPYIASRLIYTSNATSLGDILTETQHVQSENGIVKLTSSFLRVKQSLELPGNKYDYRATYVTNVSGEDKDIPFLNTSFNFAKMDGSVIDKFLKSILFTVEFPEANKIKYSYLLEGQNIVMEAPIEVDGNKMTIKMSENEKTPVYQDVLVYAFQDQDNTQMHLYMPTESFEKFFANTSVAVMVGHGQLDINNADAVAEVYNKVADAVESINLSIVTRAAK